MRSSAHHTTTGHGHQQAGQRSDGAQSAVEVEDAVVCIVVFGEEGGGIGDLAGLAEAAERDSLDKVGFICEVFFCGVAGM